MKGDDLEFMAFPILAALARKPQSTRELGKTLQMSRHALTTRLFQLRDMNYVVKRDDLKWQPLIILRMEKPPEVQPDWDGKSPIEPGEPTGPMVITPPEMKPEEESEELGVVPKTSAPIKPKGQGGSKPTGSPLAMKISKKFNVPPKRSGEEAAIAKVGQCGCGRPTPLKYGPAYVCPVCAREK